MYWAPTCITVRFVNQTNEIWHQSVAQRKTVFLCRKGWFLVVPGLTWMEVLGEFSRKRNSVSADSTTPHDMSSTLGLSELTCNRNCKQEHHYF